MMIRIKAAATLADQLASSASNSLVVLALAQVTSVEAFGRVALYLAVLTLALALVRGAFGTLLLLGGAGPVKSTRLECSLASTAAMMAYAPVALCLLAVGAVQHDLVTSLVVAAAGPPLLLQDLQRHAALARGQTMLALLWDGVWVAGSILLLVLAWHDLAVRTPAELVSCWIVLAVVSYVGLVARTRAGPKVRLLAPWLRRHLPLRVHYAAETSLGALMTTLLFTATTALAGEQSTAALRGASTLFGPLSVAMSSLPLVLIPSMARSRADLARTWRTVRPAALGLTGGALVTGLLVMALPQHIGKLLLGDVWAVTRPIIGFTSVEYAAVVWLSAMFACWRSARMGRTVFTARAAYSMTVLTLAVGAAAVFRDTPMIALSMATSGVVVTVFAVLSMHHSTRPGNVMTIPIRPAQA